MSNYLESLKRLYEMKKAAKNEPVQGRIYFHNIWGKYSDNTKALAEAYHRIHPDYELIYELGANASEENIPDYIRTTKANTKESIKLMYSSMVVVDNDWGVIKKSGIGLKGKISCSLYKSIISPKCLYVSTGHGTPLKKIGCDAVSDSSDCFITSTQLMGVWDNHSRCVYNRITMGGIERIIITGSPRNDVLYDRNDGSSIKRKLNIEGKNLVLFAPTFRTKVRNGKTIFIGVDEVLRSIKRYSDQIINALHDSLGGDWVIGLRVHPGAVNNVEDIFNEKIINANILQDMADYLSITDLLITDYSSCLFDFMITKKPCVLLWTDMTDYTSNERGVYFNKDDLPYPIACSFEELITEIKNIDNTKIYSSVTRFMKRYRFLENPKASETLINNIDKWLLSGK